MLAPRNTFMNILSFYYQNFSSTVDNGFLLFEFFMVIDHIELTFA